MKVWYMLVAGSAALLLMTGCSKGETRPATEGHAAGAPQSHGKGNHPQEDKRSPERGKEATKGTPAKEVKKMEVTLPWKDGADIPMKYVHGSKGGENVSPAVKWSKVEGAVQYLIVMVDHHPVARDWLHWVATVPGSVTEIPEGASTKGGNLKEYPNTWGNAKYEGPAAPKGTGRHDYHVVVFALSKEVSIPSRPTWAAIEKAVEGITIARGEVVGYYETK